MTDNVAPSRRRAQTRQRLFEAAAEVFSELGWDAASVETICERAGFTRGAFYSNFESKNELVLELTAEFAEAKLDRVSARIREFQTRDVGLAELVGRVIDVTMDSHSDTVLLAEIRTHALRDPALAEAYLRWHQAMVERVGGIIEEVVRVSGMTLRMPANDVSRLLMEVWEGAARDAAIARVDTAAIYAELLRRTVQIAEALTA